MKKLLLIPAVLATLGFSLSSNNTAMTAAHAVEDTGYTLGVQEILRGVYNNNLQDVDHSDLTYGVKAGYLQNGTLSHMTTKGSGEGDMSKGKAVVDWGGARLSSGSNDRIILSFQARANMTISVSANVGEGWNEHSILSYYVAPVTYNEVVPTALTPFETYVGGASFTVEQLSLDVTLKTGETFYWEWGFEWDGRNFEVVDSKLAFTFKTNDVNTAVSTNIGIADIYDATAKAGGKMFTNGLVDYGMKFGDARTQTFVDVTTDVTTDGYKYVTPNGNGGVWWQIYTDVGEGFIFTFTAKSRVTINGHLTADSLGWIDAGVALNYIVVNNGVAKTVYSSQGFDKTTFSAPKDVELLPGETLYISVNGDYGKRNLMVQAQANCWFTVTEVVTTYGTRCILNLWPTLRATNEGSLCELSEADLETLNKLISIYDELSLEQQEIINRTMDADGYTIGQSIAYFRTYLSGSRNITLVNESNYTLLIVSAISLLAVALTIILRKRLVKSN